MPSVRGSGGFLAGSVADAPPHDLPLSLVAFVKAAAPFALVQLLVATVCVLVFLR